MIMTRRKLIMGAAALVTLPAAADGLRGGIGGFDGGISAAAPVAVVPIVFPASGSSIDMDFVGNQYFGGTLATLMNVDQTQAAGALLTALTDVTAGTLVATMNPLVSPTSIDWIISGGDINVFLTDTAATRITSSVNAAAPANGIAGSGTMASIFKAAVRWQAGVGRGMVMNNGVIGTNATNFLAGETAVFFNLPNTISQYRRLTYYNTALADVPFKAAPV